MSFANIVTTIKWEDLRKPGNTPRRPPRNPMDSDNAQERMACNRAASLPKPPKGGPNRPSNM